MFSGAEDGAQLPNWLLIAFYYTHETKCTRQ